MLWIDQELRRAITLKEFTPSPYFSIINIQLVNINVFAKFYELFQDIEKQKSIADGWTRCKHYTPYPPPPPHKQFAGGIIKTNTLWSYPRTFPGKGGHSWSNLHRAENMSLSSEWSPLEFFSSKVLNNFKREFDVLMSFSEICNLIPRF